MYTERRFIMIDDRTIQFVKFNSIRKLNKWMANNTDSIVINDYKMASINNKLTIVVQFHLAGFSSTQITMDDKNPVSYEDQLKAIIKGAYDV